MTVTNLQLVKDLLWPIKKEENILFIPMAMMFMLIMFNSYILSSIKDSLVVVNSGAETLTFIRSYLVLPSSILFFFGYTKLLNIFSQNSLFYIITNSFILFFLLFAFLIYPNKDILHPHASVNYLILKLPQGLNGLIGIYQYWTFSLFYIFAELWTVVMVGILFWQFANSIIPLEIAKRFYSHFQIFANVGVMIAGQVTIILSDMNKNLIITENDRWFISQKYLLLTVVISAFLIMILHMISSKNIPNNEKTQENLKKLTIPFLKSIKLIFNSRILFLMTFLIVAYGISNNLIEVCWKNYVRTLYSSANDYNAFTGVWTTWIGITTIATVLIGGMITRNLGLRQATLAPPLVVGILSVIFFSFVMLDNKNIIAEPLLLKLIVYIGLIQVVLIKGVKYALFDPTKEMMYIPMNKEFKAKGKGAVDALGNRIGKASGGVIQQFLFIFIGPITTIAPYLAVLVLLIVFLWWIAVEKLNIIYSKKEGIEFDA